MSPEARWQMLPNLEVGLLFTSVGGGQQWVEQFRISTEEGRLPPRADRPGSQHTYCKPRSPGGRKADFTCHQVRVRQTPNVPPSNPCLLPFLPPMQLGPSAGRKMFQMGKQPAGPSQAVPQNNSVVSLSKWDTQLKI